MTRPFLSLCVRALSALLLAPGAALAQLYTTDAPLLVYYDPQGVMLNDGLLTGLLADRFRPILTANLEGTGCDVAQSAVYLVQGNKPPPQAVGVFSTYLHLGLHGVGSIPADSERKILSQLAQALQEQLKARLVDQQQQPFEANLARLREQVERAQMKSIAARRELLQAAPLTSIDQLRERAGELDRRQRDLELDLRTEQAVQELRLKLTAEATERLKDVGGRRHHSTMRLSEAQGLVAELHRSGKADPREIAKAAEEIAQRQMLVDLCAREQTAAERDLEELANQSRGATLKLHELATRRSLTADELNRTLKEIEAAAERAAATLPLQQGVAGAEADLALLHQQMADAARRRATVQPVRVEIWR